MKINSLFNQPTILPAPITEKVQAILLKMNSETNYVEKGKLWSSNILGGITSKEGRLFDSSAIIKPVTKPYEGRAKLEIGKLIVEFNPIDGTIFFAQKKFLQPWVKTFDKINTFLNNSQKNFENPDIIKKHFITLQGLTQNGVEKLLKAFEAIHPAQPRLTKQPYQNKARVSEFARGGDREFEDL